MSFFDLFKRNNNTRLVKVYEPIIAKINALEGEIKALDDAGLKAKTDEFKRRLDIKVEDTKDIINKKLEGILPEAFAVVREVARRTLGQRHFDVQLLGGMVLNSGAISEMRTGEGKTLVATLPAYLNALTGRGVHVVTVNDYLSRRDAVWMGQIYSFLGLSVGVINHESSFVYDREVSVSFATKDSRDTPSALASAAAGSRSPALAPKRPSFSFAFADTLSTLLFVFKGTFPAFALVSSLFEGS